MKRILVDTDVVSFGLRMDKSFETFYGPALLGFQPLISFMTVGEMEFGARNRNWGDKRIAALQAHLAANYVKLGGPHGSK